MEGQRLNQTQLFYHVSQHKRIVISLLVALFLGILLGSYLSVTYLTDHLTLTLPNTHVSAWTLKMYGLILLENAWVFIVIYIGSLSFIGVPLIYFGWLVLGMRIGYTVAICISTFQLRGVGIAFSVLIIDQLILLPLTCCFGVYALLIHRQLFFKHAPAVAAQLSTKLRQYHYRFIVYLIVVALLSVLESSYYTYIYPYIMSVFS